MKEVSDCLDRAVICDELAAQSHDADTRRLLLDVAIQWRRLGAQTAKHKWMIARSFPRGEQN